MESCTRLRLHRPMPLSQKISYGVGHVLNDLCASMWFTYLLIYFHSVINFSNTKAGNLMMIGQVCDAISTPFVGIESDRTKGIFGYGKRKSWHLLGTICVACSFPFLFVECLVCSSNTSDTAKFIYYLPFVIIFQFGWASTQISHLSLIPDLTADEGERVFLNAIRYAFTVISNLIVYIITWLLLELNVHHATKAHTIVSPTGGKSGMYNTTTLLEVSSDDDDLSSADKYSFRTLALIVVAIGVVFSSVFHVGTKEPSKIDSHSDVVQKCPTVNRFQEDDENMPLVSPLAPRRIMTWTHWFKEAQFYLIGLLYMLTRLIINVSQVYLPFYLTDTLALRKQTIAYIPLASYIVGLLVSFLIKAINKKIGRKPAYFVGLLFIVGCCALMYFLRDSTHNIVIYAFGAAALLGAGGSTILITSLAMVSDLVSHNAESGAFVYGAMSFTDKLSNGAAILIVQHLQPCGDSLTCCAACTPYYRDVMVFIPGACALLALLILVILIPQKIGHRPHSLTETISGQSAGSMEDGDSLPSNEKLQNCAKNLERANSGPSNEKLQNCAKSLERANSGPSNEKLQNCAKNLEGANSTET